MRFVHVTCLTAALGFAFALGLHAQRGGDGRAGAAVAAPSSPIHSTRSGVSSGLNIGGRPYPIRTDIPAPVGLNSPAAAYTGILPGAYRIGSGRTESGRGHNRGSQFYPGYAAPLFLPWDPGFSPFPGYDSSTPPVDPNAQAMADSQDAMAQQIQQLAMEVQQIKSNGQQTSAPVPVTYAVPENQPPVPPVTLILRDGQQLSVENYAVMNQTFWNFSKHPAQKIPIADINLAASAKATEANGGEFPLTELLQ